MPQESFTRTVKCSLETFCKDKTLLDIIRCKATQMNYIQIETLHFIGIELRLNCEEIFNNSIRKDLIEPYSKR